MSQSLSIGQREPLKIKIQSRTAKVGVIGMGYVGLPLALLFSEQSFLVTGFDIDKKKVDVLESGGSYIYRIAPTEIQAARSHGFTATSDYSNITSLISATSATRQKRSHRICVRVNWSSWRARPIPARPKKFWCLFSSV